MMCESESNFNAGMYVSDRLSRELSNVCQDVSMRCVGVLADKYGFNAEEEIRLLGLSTIKVSGGKKKVVKEKVVVAKPRFPLPYSGEFNDSLCNALRQNNGLYTQCNGKRKEDGSFCKGCETMMQKTGSEEPEYGTIQQRMSTGIFEYTDPKGRKPVAYTKVMKKHKISKEDVMEEAGKFNITVNEGHFVAPVDCVKRGRPKSEKESKPKGAKGRPKKEKKVVSVEECECEDLFATLVANAFKEEDGAEAAVHESAKKEREDKLASVSASVAAAKKEAERLEKEAKRLAKEEEKEAKRLAAEAAKKEKEEKAAAEKAEKAAKKEAEKEAKEAEKEVKRLVAEAAKKEKEEKAAAEKAEKVAKKEAEKEAKEAEKEAKRLAAESAKKEKESKSAKKAAADEDEEEEPDVVKKIEFEGKKYLKSKKSGICYDYSEYVTNGEQVVIGKWNNNTNKIEFEASEEEEVEEEYE